MLYEYETTTLLIFLFSKNIGVYLIKECWTYSSYVYQLSSYVSYVYQLSSYVSGLGSSTLLRNTGVYVGIIGFDGADLNNGVALVGGELFVARLSISLLVSGTLLLGILVAKFVGTSLPMLVAAFKKDPALISSPFVTTIVDVCSLLIYIGLATIVFNTILG